MLVQPAAEGSPSRDEAIAKAHLRALQHRAAFERLGARFDVDPEETVIEWEDAWGTPLAPLVPLSAPLVRAAVAHLVELERDLDAALGALSDTDWDRRDGPDGWSVRMVVDHIAQGYILFTERLEPWPLAADEAQLAAVDDLLARVAAQGQSPTATALFGWNLENGRVRWTPRKVLRVVGGLQRAWLDHIAGGPRPRIASGHEDVKGDELAADAAQVAVVRHQDTELRRIGREHPAVREVAWWYRYYRDRLASWPTDELDRWRTTRSAFHDLLLSMDETDLALVRMAPSGACTSVRQQLGVALAHIQEHSAQIAQISRAAPT